MASPWARQSKYRNRKASVDGITFDSRKEAARWSELIMLEKAGLISGLQRQVRFEVVPKQADERAVCYVADFVYTERGRRIIEDVKSPITRKDRAYVIKRKLVKWQYRDCTFRET